MNQDAVIKKVKGFFLDVQFFYDRAQGEYHLHCLRLLDSLGSVYFGVCFLKIEFLFCTFLKTLFDSLFLSEIAKSRYENRCSHIIFTRATMIVTPPTVSVA